jgi:2-iminoacetate synthase ThiH
LPAVGEVLDKALDGERITDDDAIALLRSRDLVAVGRVANEIRSRLTDPSRVTFIVDRNLNYTNVCVTDCDFCAFYRRPGDQREGYLLPKPVIFKKIEETLALGGTGLLMQGGHHPDLGIDYYEDLFTSIKARYKIHLHALSPPEIQHIARRSKPRFRRPSRVCATPGSTPCPVAARRFSSIACAGSSLRRRRSRTRGSTSCARLIGSECRRPRR